MRVSFTFSKSCEMVRWWMRSQWTLLKASLSFKELKARMGTWWVVSLRSLNQRKLLWKWWTKRKNDSLVYMLAPSSPCICVPLWGISVVILCPFVGFCNCFEQWRPLGMPFILIAFTIIFLFLTFFPREFDVMISFMGCTDTSLRIHWIWPPHWVTRIPFKDPTIWLPH